MLGLGTKDQTKAKDEKTSKQATKNDDARNDEAKKILEQMEAKKADGDCPFC
jgi:hypothetical protein